MLLLVSEDSPVKHQLLPGDVVRGVKVDGVTLNEASGWRNKDGLERLLWESQDRKRHLVVSKEASYTTPRTEFSGQPAHSFFSNKYVFTTHSRSRSLTAGGPERFTGICCRFTSSTTYALQGLITIVVGVAFVWFSWIQARPTPPCHMCIETELTLHNLPGT